jgi:hypothetical protein
LFWAFVAVLTALGLPRAAPGALEQGQAATPPPGETVVALKGIPLWEIANERVHQSFLRGRYAQVQKVSIVQYPEFVSDAPLCGQITFQNPGEGARGSDVCFFAVDCSQKGGNYDRLYFEHNGRTDLRNGKPRSRRLSEVMGITESGISKVPM